MACGLPIIANGASVMPEIIGRTQSELNYGPAERGWLVGNRVEIFPPAKLIKIIRNDALGQAIWEVTNWKDTKGLRENCINYAKERTWDVMKREICKLLDLTGGPVSLPVEVIE
jgi:glycosyltransferase involved in cell wall biosynthesis